MTGRDTKLAVLISGSGRTMVNLAQCIERGDLHARIMLVIASRADAGGIDRARELGLSTQIVARRQYATVEAFSQAVWQAIRPAGVDLVCLAGFLSLLQIPDEFRGRVINIHPALLPRFGGKGMYGHHVHEAVLAAGETESGCTVHICDNEYDRGEILVQRRCPVLAGDTAQTLAARVFEQECLAYPQAIRLVQQRLERQENQR
jgi:phosphoribosylglycinamide formyltransferase 1